LAHGHWPMPITANNVGQRSFVMVQITALLLAALAVASASPVDDNEAALLEARGALDSMLAEKMQAETELADFQGKSMKQDQATQLAKLEVDGLRNEEKFAKSDDAELSAKVEKREKQKDLSGQRVEIQEAQDAQQALLSDQDAIKAIKKAAEAKKAWVKEHTPGLQRLRSQTAKDEAAFDLAQRKFEETAASLKAAKAELETLQRNLTLSESSTEVKEVQLQGLKKARADRLAQDKQTAEEMSAARDELKRDSEKLKEEEKEEEEEAQEASISLAKEKATEKSEEEDILNKSAAAKELAAAKADLDAKKKVNSAIWEQKAAEHEQEMKDLEAKWQKEAVASISDLQDQKQDKEDELGRVRARNKVESAKLQTRLESLKKDLDVADKLRDSVDKDAQQKEDNIRANSRAMVENDRTAVEKLQGKHEELLDTERDLSDRVGSAGAELTKTMQDLESAKARLAAVKEREREHFQKKLKDVKEADLKENDILQKDVADLKGKYDAIERDRMHEVTDLNHEMKALKEKNGKLRGHIH